MTFPTPGREQQAAGGSFPSARRPPAGRSRPSRLPGMGVSTSISTSRAEQARGWLTTTVRSVFPCIPEHTLEGLQTQVYTVRWKTSEGSFQGDHTGHHCSTESPSAVLTYAHLSIRPQSLRQPTFPRRSNRPPPAPTSVDAGRRWLSPMTLLRGSAQSVLVTRSYGLSSTLLTHRLSGSVPAAPIAWGGFPSLVVCLENIHLPPHESAQLSWGPLRPSLGQGSRWVTAGSWQGSVHVLVWVVSLLLLTPLPGDPRTCTPPSPILCLWETLQGHPSNGPAH